MIRVQEDFQCSASELSDKFHLSSGGGVSELIVFSRNLKFVVKDDPVQI